LVRLVRSMNTAAMTAAMPPLTGLVQRFPGARQAPIRTPLSHFILRLAGFVAPFLSR
jgi:hypothetical protein